MFWTRDNHQHIAQLDLRSEVDHFEYTEARPTLLMFWMVNQIQLFGFLKKSTSRHSDFQHPTKYLCGSSLGTKSELVPSSDRAERRADGPHASRIIIRSHSINMTVPDGDPEALEQQFAAKTVFFLFQSVGTREAPNGFQ